MNLTKNTTQKLISLLFAIVFWIFVMDTENPEIVKPFNRIPIEYLGIEQLSEEQLEIVGDYTRVLDVKVRGRRNDVLTLSSKDVRITADLYQAKEGDGVFPIVVTILNNNVSIESVESTSVKLTFDAIIEREVKVTIHKNGEISPPYSLDEVTSNPPNVIVKGPKRFVGEIDAVVANVDLSDASSDFEWISTLMPLDVNGDVINRLTLSSKEATITTKILMEKVVPVVPLIVDELPLGYELTSALLNHDSVTLIGNPDIIAGIDGVTIDPVSLSGRIISSSEDVELALPNGVKASSSQEFKLDLTIEPIVERAFDLSIDQITWLNKDENVQIKLVDGEFYTLTLKGIESLIKDLTIDDLKLLVEVSDLVIGENTLPVTLVIDDEIEWTMPEDLRVIKIELLDTQQ
jgi:YbbR domain-containing protein